MKTGDVISAWDGLFSAVHVKDTLWYVAETVGPVVKVYRAQAKDYLHNIQYVTILGHVGTADRAWKNTLPAWYIPLVIPLEEVALLIDHRASLVRDAVRTRLAVTEDLP